MSGSRTGGEGSRPGGSGTGSGRDGSGRKGSEGCVGGSSGSPGCGRSVNELCIKQNLLMGFGSARKLFELPEKISSCFGILAPPLKELRIHLNPGHPVPLQ